MRRTLPLLVVLVAALAVGVPTAAAAGTLDVTQADDGSATVTVTENGSGVSDATVVVRTADENVTYAGTGDYATDENGTVALPAPDATVNASVTASYDDETLSSVVTLAAADANGSDATNSTHDGDATNDTGDGNATDGANATPSDFGPFGRLVSAFVHDLQDDAANDTGIGPMVATFALEHGPAADKVPDHAGPPVDVGPPEHAGPPENGTRGPPGHAGPPENETRGPPEHAGPPERGERGNDTGPGGEFRPVDVGPPEHAGPDRGGDDGDSGQPEGAGGP